jgi:plastocyanin
MRRVLVSAGLLITFVMVAFTFAVPAIEAGGGYGGCTRPRDGAHEAVVIRDNCFSPAVLYVDVDETVTWTNEDAAGHNVTLFGGELLGEQQRFFQGGQSGLLQGQSLSFKFDEPGLYPYYCTIHPAMIGVVAVGEASAATAGSNLSAASIAGGGDPGLPPGYLLAAGMAAGVAATAAGARLYRRASGSGTA